MQVKSIQRIMIGAGIAGQGFGWEDKLPDPLSFGVSIFTIQSVGQRGAAVSFLQIGMMQLFYLRQMLLQCRRNPIGQCCGAILLPFAIADND